MFRCIALLCCLLGVLFADEKITIRSIEFYNRPPERLDIMLAFDAPYSHEIRQQSHGNYQSIILSQAILNEEKQEMIQAFGLEAVKISQINEEVYIILLGEEVNIQASKVIEGYGLRFRITKKSHDPVDKIKEGLEFLPIPDQES